MSRTYKDRLQRLNKPRRVIKNKEMQALTGFFGDDLYYKNPKSRRFTTKQIRRKLQRQNDKEIERYL